jgi:hypothetical protein
MAFFVSKDLEGRVDENSLIPNSSVERISKEFVLQVDEVEFQIIEIKFFNNDIFDYAEIECECNIYAVDYLAFSKESGKIYFKNNTIEISDLQIIKILKKDNDIYSIRVNGSIPRGKINV